MFSSRIPPLPEWPLASHTNRVRLLRAVTMSEIERQAYRRALANSMSDALRQPGEPDLQWYCLRWQLSFNSETRLTRGEALRLVGELRWEADCATGDERLVLLTLVRRWRARLRR
jgi:hypothetical protein